MSRIFKIFIAALLICNLTACEDETSLQQAESTDVPDCGPQICAQGAALRAVYDGPIAGWPTVQTSEDTPFEEMAPLERPKLSSQDLEVQLGEYLFFDPILSDSGQIACASCHNPDLAFADGIRSAIGDRRQSGPRNSPTLLDKANQPHFMWNGSSDSFEHQALLPIENPVEMASDIESVLRRLNSDETYRSRFQNAFQTTQISISELSSALSAYQRALTRRSLFDRFLEGERGRLNDQEVFGLHVFRTSARCMTCHSGPRFTDDQFHNIGLHYYGRRFQDLGRYEITNNAEDVGAFRTPSLRHVSRTAPYMHNGLFPSLAGIVNLYNAGGARPRPRAEFADDPLFPETTELLPELNLSPEERAALVAFLETL